MTLSASRLWRDYPREAVALATLGCAALVAMAGSAVSSPGISGLSHTEAAEIATPPAPPPLIVRQLAPHDALSINHNMPVAAGPNPAASPFVLKGNSAARAQALECLTSAVYYEAGSQDTDGQKAVAQVVLNRVRHGAFPASVCGVVYQGSTRPTGCQFTFTCDGSLARGASSDGWARARKVAEAALAGVVYAPVGYATHYHADYVVPYWASSLAKNMVVGAHIFYRWAGGWGRAPAFTQSYSGREPDARALRSAAMAAEAAQPAPASVAEAVAEIPGAELKPIAGRQVSVRFKLAARKAVEETPHTAYVEKVQASDNLRWTLGAGAPQTDQKPLGKAVPAAAAGGAGAL